MRLAGIRIVLCLLVIAVTFLASCSGGTRDPQDIPKEDISDFFAYRVLIDRFSDGDSSNNAVATPGVDSRVDFHGGDLVGIENKITSGYFTELGVNILVLSCPFMNTNATGIQTDGHLYAAYEGEWSIDFAAIDSRFGTTADFDRAVDAAHARGIRVIIEAAPRHAHDSSSIYSSHLDWFRSSYGVLGYDCSWESADAYKHGLRQFLPPLNLENISALTYSIDSLSSWIEDKGVDGFMLRYMQFTDDRWLPAFRSRIFSSVDSSRDSAGLLLVDVDGSGMLSELLDASTKADGGIDWNLSRSFSALVLGRNGSMTDLEAILARYLGLARGNICIAISPGPYRRPMNLALDTPDNGSNGWGFAPDVTPSAYQRLALAYAIAFSIPGMPYMEYGDEIGMSGDAKPASQAMMRFPSEGIEADLMNRIALLASIRKTHPAMRKGSLTSLGAGDDYAAFRMTYGSDSVVVVANRADSDTTIFCLPDASYVDQISGSRFAGTSVNISGRTAMILVAE